MVLVYFIGGVTYGEIATLRLLGKILSNFLIKYRKGDRGGDYVNNKRGQNDKGLHGDLDFIMILIDTFIFLHNFFSFAYSIFS